MSQTGNSIPSWDTIAEYVGDFVGAVVPIIEAADPAAAIAIGLGEKILQGVLAGVPEAVSLFNDIKNGATPTADELQRYAANYEASYQQLKADINAQIAKLPPA